MPTAQVPRGKAITLLIKDQSVDFKTPATGNYLTTLAYKYGVVEEQPLEDDPILGEALVNTRDDNAAADGLPDVKGQIAVPLDFSHFGYWLKSLFGAPATSGTTPDYTHVFTSGGLVLPEKTVEVQIPKSGGTILLQHVGLMVPKATLQVSRKAGFQQVLLDCTGYKENKLGSTGAGTPVAAVARDPIAAARGVYKIDGTVAGDIMEVSGTYDNNFDGKDEVGDDHIGGYDVGIATFRGTIKLRFRTTSMYDDAIAATEHAGEISFTKSPVRSLALAAPTLRLQRSGVPIEGPGRIEQTFNFRCRQTASVPMLTATLKSAVASY
jgi:hypothetical protein